VIVWPGARRSRRSSRLVWSGWVALLVGTVVGLLVYGPYAAGLGLGDATKFSLLSTTIGTRFGELSSVRLLLLVLAVPVLRALLARSGPSSPIPARGLALGGGTLAVLLAATPGLAGHAVTGRWVTAAVMADSLHVLAMAVWLGGLVMLVGVLLPKRSVTELRDTLPRWSRIAAGCVIVIVGTGAFQAWRQVGGLAELRATDYGRILIVKVVLFAVILALASFAREIVFHLYPRSAAEPGVRMPVVAGGSDDDPRDRGTHDLDAGDDVDEAKVLRNLRRSVWAELGVGVAVLIVTALLVNAAPARTAAAGSGNATSVSLTLKSATVRVGVLLTPGQPGPNDVHVSTLRPNGATQDVQDLRLTLDLPSRKIAPITVPVTKLSAGHYLGSSVALPIAGTWRVTAYPRLSQFDEVTLTGTFDLGS
jgi:copper transport protein